MSDTVNKLDTEQRKIRTEFLNANTQRVASEQTYTASPKMRKYSIPHLIKKTMKQCNIDKLSGQHRVDALGLR